MHLIQGGMVRKTLAFPTQAPRQSVTQEAVVIQDEGHTMPPADEFPASTSELIDMQEEWPLAEKFKDTATARLEYVSSS